MKITVCLLVLLLATPIWAGEVIIVGGSALNGDFNANPGGSVDFSSTAEWYNLGGVQTVVATRDNVAYDGSQNALISSSAKIFGLDTGYTIADGDIFDISYVWRDASGWDDPSDQIRVSLFVTDDNTLAGVRTDLVIDLSETSTQNNTYEAVGHDSIYTATTMDAGKTLFVAIDSTCAVSEFARLDNFELVVQGPGIYYVSATGNNGNDGLSPASAWLDVDALDGRTFKAGDQILFNRGDTFAGACTLLGSGATNNPIYIGAYGAGEKPLLTGDANDAEIFLLSSGNEYIEFHDLQLSNFNTNNASVIERYGIHTAPSAGSGEINHLHFRNLDLFDIRGYGHAVHEDDHRSTGILALTVNDDTNPTRFNDYLIEGCTFADIDGLGAQLKDTSQDITDKKIRGTDYFPTVGFIFQNNYGTNLYRNMLQLRGTKDALVQYNTMDTTVEGSAFWPFGTDGTVVQYNVFKHLRADDADAYACHFDYNCVDTLMQYNIGYDIEGGLVEIIVNSQFASTFQENAIARYNIGIDVGWRNKTNGAAIFLSGDVIDSQVYNNTIVQLDKPHYKAISFNNWGGSWPTNSVIYNNIFYAGGTTSTYVGPIRGINHGNVVSHNLYWGNVEPPEVWDGTPVDQNPFTNNPSFANPTGLNAEDFKVLFGSASISNGLLVAGNGGLDYFGYNVSSNTLPTIGFHEYQSDPIVDSDGDAMTDLWETSFGLNPGNPADATLDPDNDRLQNLGEFAVGGDPTNPLDVGYVSEAEIVDIGGGTNRLVYIYPRRTDWVEIGLDYDLGVSTNLITGPWVNWAHWIAGVGSEAYGQGFDAVTNYLSLDNAFNQRFIRLEIEVP
jgi:hypothetical protein